MATQRDTDHWRKIQEILDGEISIWGSSDGGTTFFPIKVGDDGILSVGNALSEYAIANIDGDGTPNYYGFLKSDGTYYIMKEVLSAGADIYTYTRGISDYSTAWTNRATEDYGTFAAKF